MFGVLEFCSLIKPTSQHQIILLDKSGYFFLLCLNFTFAAAFISKSLAITEFSLSCSSKLSTLVVNFCIASTRAESDLCHGSEASREELWTFTGLKEDSSFHAIAACNLRVVVFTCGRGYTRFIFFFSRSACWTSGSGDVFNKGKQHSGRVKVRRQTHTCPLHHPTTNL